MSNSLIIASICFCLFIITFILVLLRRRKISIKYSLIWVILFFMLLIATIVPGFLVNVTHLLGFVTPSNMIFTLILSVLVIITIILSVTVSSQGRRIRLLIQEISILKSKTEDNNE